MKIGQSTSLVHQSSPPIAYSPPSRTVWLSVITELDWWTGLQLSHKTGNIVKAKCVGGGGGRGENKDREAGVYNSTTTKLEYVIIYVKA